MPTTKASSSPEPAVGAEFYRDPLTSDAGNGWFVGSTTSLNTLFSSGYDVKLSAPNTLAYLRPDFRGVRPSQLKDVAIKVIAERTLSVGDLTFYGVFCRQDPTDKTDPKHTGLHYGFYVSEGNEKEGNAYPVRYKISRGTSDSARTLVSTDGTSNQAVQLEVQGICVDDETGRAHLDLIVDGKTVLRTIDAHALPSGYPGISVENSNDAPAVIFHDFSLRSATLK